MSESTDFDVKYRPQKLAEVLGQDAAVKAVRAFKGNVPRTLLFHGASGSGKTTLARIVVREVLGMDLERNADVVEANCASWQSPIDKVRDIEANCRLSAMTAGGKRVWILDEVQSLSRTAAAQNALLKVLESSPAHALFMLCTTNPEKLIKPVRNRCTEIAIRPLTAKAVEALITRIERAENLTLTDEVRDRLVALCEGTARSVCKYLQKIATVTDEAEQLEILGRGLGDEGCDEFALAKALLFNGKPTWPDVAKVLTELDEAQPETLRCVAVNAARSALLKKGSLQAYRVISCLDKPLYEPATAKALLAMMCFEFCAAMQKG